MVNEETLTPPMRFGWVGLGAMGYPMAGQLRRKLPRTSTLWIYDIDFALTSWKKRLALQKTVLMVLKCVLVVVPAR